MSGFDPPDVGAASPIVTALPMAQVFAIHGPYPDPAMQGAQGTLAMVRTLAADYDAFGAPDCFGQSVPIAPNQPLFQLIGTLYGGDGQVNFALPDLRGRVALGGGPGQPPVQGALSMTYLIAARIESPIQFQWPPLGSIALYAADASAGPLPGGWLPADGSLLPVTQYPELFNAIGTSFGGDGQTNFMLPSLGGAAPIGTGQGNLLPPVPLGLRFDAGGAWTFAGTGLNYLINLNGVTPSPGPGWLPGREPMITEVIAYAGIQIPDGWMDAAGQLLPIAEYGMLFQLLGTRYGGDGQTNFALPNLSGMMITGRVPGAG